MMKRYVYILSEYEEHGAKNVVATLDRTKLPDLLVLNWQGQYAHELKELSKLLQAEDAAICSRNGHDLSDGWGGIMLHVIELN